MCEDASWFVAVEDRPRADASMKPNGYIVFRGTASVTDAMLDLAVTPSLRTSGFREVSTNGLYSSKIL